MALNVIINIAYTPIMIRLLGQSEYGLYNTITSTISMLSILSLGFNSGYIKYYAKYKKNDDNQSIYKLNGLFFLIFTAIGIIAFICGLFLTFHLDLIFKTGLTTQEYSIAKVLMLILTINLAISFPFSVFTSIISANEKFVFLKLINMITNILGPLVTLPLLLMGYRSITLVTVSLIISIITGLINYHYIRHTLKNKFVFKNFEKGILKNLFSYTIFIAINILIDQINWQIDKILLGRFKGTIAVTIYSVGYIFFNSYMAFSTAISNVFTPRIHKIINYYKNNIEQQKQQLTNLFTKIGRIQFFILGLVATGFIFFGKEFIYIWVGKEYSDSYYVALLLILPSSIALIQNLGIEIQRAQNNHKFRSFAYLVMAIINIIMSVILCQKYSAIGCAIGTAISLVIANGFIMNIYYNRKCNINIPYFWKSIIKPALTLIIPCSYGAIYKHFIDCSGIFTLIISIILYTIIYIGSIWLIALNDYEKQLIINPLNKISKILKR